MFSCDVKVGPCTRSPGRDKGHICFNSSAVFLTKAVRLYCCRKSNVPSLAAQAVGEFVNPSFMFVRAYMSSGRLWCSVNTIEQTCTSSGMDIPGVAIGAP